MRKIVTGNEAAAYGAMLCRPRVISAYPITPQSRIPEQLAEFHAQGILDGKLVNAESEMGALGYVLGASAGGVRVFTATASQGLALMHEQLHWVAGARLPIVMAEVNRTLAVPGSIQAEWNDSLSQRDTGWMQFYCESNQEILDTIIQAYRISETVSLPSMVIFEGVYLSFVSESIEIPEQEKVDRYLPPYEPSYEGGFPIKQYKLFDNEPPEPGGYIPQNIMGVRYEIQKAQDRCADVALRADDEFQALFGRGYPLVEEYRCSDADVVVVMVGSSVGTGRYVIDKLRGKEIKVGLVKIKMFRPFPVELVRRALAKRKKIAIIERDISPGQCGVFSQEIKWALNSGVTEGCAPVYGFVCGLGGRDISPGLIEKAIMFTLVNDPPRQQVIWLGLEEKGVTDEYDRSTLKMQ